MSGGAATLTAVDHSLRGPLSDHGLELAASALVSDWYSENLQELSTKDVRQGLGKLSDKLSNRFNTIIRNALSAALNGTGGVGLSGDLIYGEQQNEASRTHHNEL